MSEVTRIGFLIRGTKEKLEGDIFHEHHLHQIPIWTGFRIAFLASYCGNNSGTIGNRYASTACNERSELYGDFDI